MKASGQEPAPRPYRMRARREAAQATARAISSAARRLFAEQPYDEVSLPAVAADAGVTVQTVLRRFGSKDRLFAAAARERSEEIRAEREAGTPGDVSHLVEHYDRWGDEQLHLIAHEARTPAIRTVTDAGRKYHREWVGRSFGSRLDAFPARVRRRKLAQLTAVTDLAMWGLLRRELALSRHETEAAIEELVAACLAHEHAASMPPVRHKRADDVAGTGL
jgi:AcrR family transcriptional regulator